MSHQIRFDDELHRTGEQTPVASRPISQALAWWIGAELVRRHPEELRIIETHPGGGQYDCVSVYRVAGDAAEPEVVVHMNVDAGAHLTHQSWFSEEDAERFNWLEVLLTQDRRNYVVAQLEQAEGLTSPKRTPTTTSASIGPLVISAFLQRSLLGPARWRADNGVADSSSYGAAVRDALFEKMPDSRLWASSAPAAGFGMAEYRFWFLSREGPDGEESSAPAVAIDTWSGLLWSGAETRVDLMNCYAQVEKSLDGLVSAVCPPAF